ncbi:MAG: hypothetical protein JWN83_2177 [Chitinophagaceae bacterium]|nr:hypothetical protein [Chitinophagaceae bacterium]
MKKQLQSIITALSFLFFPATNFAQAPNLGTAANFVLFSSTGAVGNTGISQLTGNIGTNSGAITGFGNVNGVMHTPDGATAQCATDVLAAYTQLNTTASTSVHGPVLGNGETLFAGVYSMSAAASVNGVLTLDAQNNANAVFIFKTGGALTTAASATVNLINGALACKVFWIAEGAISMAALTTMRGTLIANNGALDMGDGGLLEGRAFSTAGAVSVYGTLAYIPIGCGSPLLTGPPAPNLASTTCYTIFSGNGLVTNTGITNVTGDVGTNAGSTTGYDPLLVNGSIHPIPDGSTATCAADLLTVYSYLDSLPHDIELLYPAQFGNNLVLTPHIYLMNAATAFTGTVYLNAQGNAAAIFVIKINGALTTSTFSKVKLINGAQAANVFWKVEGAVTINDNSVFNGTIVANNGAINLNTADSLNGKAFTTNGAVTSNAIVATAPSGSCFLLPVSWLYFQGKPLQKNVLLEWATTNEINSGFFTIEKRRGQTFETLTSVNTNPGNGNAQQHYSFTDRQPYSINYYRISQTDKDGKKSYFRTIQVKMDINPGLKVLHYVQGNYIYVQTSDALPANGSIELYSMDGKRMSSQNVMLTKEISTYKIEKPLHKGVYLFNIASYRETIYNGKVVVL